jgi:hypothetical protein
MTLLSLFIAIYSLISQIVWPIPIQASFGQNGVDIQVSASLASQSDISLATLVNFQATGTVTRSGNTYPFEAVGVARPLPPRMDTRFKIGQRTVDVSCAASTHPDQKIHIICASPQYPDTPFDISASAGPLQPIMEQLTK